MASNDGSSATVLLAFLAGAIAGAAAALLLAPSAGEETREVLGEHVRNGRSKARDIFERAREEFERAVETEPGT